ncbi:mitotic spindle assembly checkpoint protein MAD2B isoform X1 [Pipra filicauda]|uniref:Mitotic spindle assembly checkpoint protein MAD2B n=2 Tax=Pipra filicauda TaxID=649802 RepID=A0A7R5KLF3_9PASS|nr:mitotic spindle assembly checkpoint protein MAD2B isoform X1 [Pipra filicauda]
MAHSKALQVTHRPPDPGLIKQHKHGEKDKRQVKEELQGEAGNPGDWKQDMEIFLTRRLVQGLGKMTTLTRQDLNFGQVVADVLSEFLEVAVHLILYVREVYPIGIFQKRKKYNVPVQMSCHPELNQYIQDTLHCVKPLLEKNDVEKVVVVILDKEHHPVERFVFEITQPPLLSISSESLLSHVEQLLRAFILKISVCDAVLDNNPPGCTFTVLVHTREAATRNMEKIQVIKDFPWILADEQDVHMHDPRLIPLKTMTSDILKMQLYVEERAHKGT